jgi:hypothetical protein
MLELQQPANHRLPVCDCSQGAVLPPSRLSYLLSPPSLWPIAHSPWPIPRPRPPVLSTAPATGVLLYWASPSSAVLEPPTAPITLSLHPLSTLSLHSPTTGPSKRRFCAPLHSAPHVATASCSVCRLPVCRPPACLVQNVPHVPQHATNANLLPNAMCPSAPLSAPLSPVCQSRA